MLLQKEKPGRIAPTGQILQILFAQECIECDSFLAQLNHFLEAYEADQAQKN